jgi:uncharacterized membrane protein
VIFIEDKMNKMSDEANEDILFAKYEELENLKQVIDNQIKNIEDNCDEKTLKKINETKDYLNETDTKTAKKLNKIKQLSEKEKISIKTANKASEKVINDHIKKLNKKNKNLSLYHKVLEALKEQVDIDPSRLLALTDGIFGIVMTLLIFGISSPVLDSTSNSQFINSVYAMIPNIGITLVSFILLASFWVYHHQFLKIKKLNMPYLWLNVLFLASVSFIPYGTYLVGNYSQFFLANVIFGINILLTILFFLIMYHYANNHGFLEKDVSENEKTYVNHTLYIIMGVTILVNLLDFNVNHNFIYLFLLVPIISTIRDIIFTIKD